MTHEEHKKRHQELHRALDELLADWLRHHPGQRLGTLTVMELMTWANEEQQDPTPDPE